MRLAIVGCLLAAAVVGIKGFLYGDTPVLRVGLSPSAVVVAPDGRTIYLANSDDNITPVSTATGKARRRIAISYGSPGRNAGTDSMAITPDGRTLFTTVTDAVTQASLALARVDLRAGREVGRVHVPGGVDQFVMTKDGRTLYVLSGDSALYPVDVATGRVGTAIPAPDYMLESAVSMAISPDDATLYIATNEDGPDGSDVLSGAVTPVTLRTGRGRKLDQARLDAVIASHHARRPHALRRHRRAERNRAAGTQRRRCHRHRHRPAARDTAWQAAPLYLQMAPDGKTVWVASVVDHRIGTADDTVTGIDVATGRPGPSFSTSGWLNAYTDGPAGMAMSPDGQTLYVTMPSGLERFRLS